MRTNQEYKDAALNALSGNWSPAVLATVIYILIAGFFSGYDAVAGQSQATAWMGGASLLVSIFVLFPLQYAYDNAVRMLYTQNNSEILSTSFRLFTTNYLHNVKVLFLTYLRVILWSLLLVIPGIYRAFQLAMVPYILADNPEIEAREACRLSTEMMDGHKFDYFYLQLSFIGWLILGIFTLGIGYLWLIPYMQTACAAFYEDLKNGGFDLVHDAKIVE